jgi:hypothetical protein
VRRRRRRRRMCWRRRMRRRGRRRWRSVGGGGGGHVRFEEGGHAPKSNRSAVHGQNHIPSFDFYCRG